ncbi:coproporphyrinogen III oxidase [Bacilli bacterium]|nr:coproporphyrinogen III oxidase [Bacilli bacterium]
MLSDINESDFLKAYLMEIEYYSKILGDITVNTIFFGGGTPSLMSVEFLGAILDKIQNVFNVKDGAEISLEVNPTTIEANKFREFRRLGINRLSIGVQSLADKYLRFFRRTHTRKGVLEAIAVAQECFEDNYSIDLIYARPNQTISEWLGELEEAVELSPNHISLYQLTIEPETEFGRTGVRTADDGVASEMYGLTNEFLESKNIPLYEVSNYAKKGWECRHNLNYWNSGQWLGIGAGAHSRLCFKNEFVDGYKPRTAVENIKNPVQWQLNTLKFGHGSSSRTNLTKNEFMEEILLMGLRMRCGIDINNVKKYLNLYSNNIREILNDNYKFLSEERYIEVSSDSIRIPLDHFNILDSIVERVI